MEAFNDTQKVINSYERILCTVSGGSDSDVMLDMFARLDHDKKVYYLYIVPGLEYEATKRHIKYLEEKYDIKIHISYAVKTIQELCREEGQPFVSKYVSSMISRLQKHGFDFSDEPYEVLKKKYPKCQAGVKWWCNENGKGSQFNIERNKGLKEFMILFPPAHKVASVCCKTKQKLIAEAIKQWNIQLDVYGVRKAEGGIRATAYKGCFTKGTKKVDEYRPLYYFTDNMKNLYEEIFEIRHSDCYGKYELDRTGCVGCPYGKSIRAELDAARKYEPELYDEAINTFQDAYLYTSMYNDYKDKGMVSADSLGKYEERHEGYISGIGPVYVQESLF